VNERSQKQKNTLLTNFKNVNLIILLARYLKTFPRLLQDSKIKVPIPLGDMKSLIMRPVVQLVGQSYHF
jgi:hypothetical protein